MELALHAVAFGRALHEVARALLLGVGAPELKVVKAVPL